MKGEMSILGKEGDSKILWDSNNPDEVANARKTFNAFVKEKKFACFTLDKLGEAKKKVTEFDPNEEKYVFVPPIAGGG